MKYQPPYESFRKSQRKRKIYGPMLVGSIALLLAAAGIYFIIQWVNGSGGIHLAFLNTKTPTGTATYTPPPPSATPTESPIPSATLPPEEAPTATASAPFAYTVEAGDTLESIAAQFDIEDVFFLMRFNNLTTEDFIYPGQTLIIPDPNTGLPTLTPIPPNLPSGTIIEYIVEPGDNLGLIAEKFLTTEEAILEENDIENAYLIFPGDVLLIPYKLITPTFGPPASGGTETPSPTSTP